MMLHQIGQYYLLNKKVKMDKFVTKQNAPSTSEEMVRKMTTRKMTTLHRIYCN